MAPQLNRILVAEDHSLVREGIKQVLADNAGYRIVGESGDGLAVYSACQTLQPDVVLLDLGLPGMNGMEVARRLKRRWPTLIVIILTAEASEFRAREAFDAGASAYALKKSAQKTLLDALATALAGGIFLDPSLDEAQVTAAPNMPSTTTLTARERQIVWLA